MSAALGDPTMLCSQRKTTLELLFIKTNLDVLGGKNLHGAVRQEDSPQAASLPSPRKPGQSLGWPSLSARGPPHSGAMLPVDFR